MDAPPAFQVGAVKPLAIVPFVMVPCGALRSDVSGVSEHSVALQRRSTIRYRSVSRASLDLTLGDVRRTSICRPGQRDNEAGISPGPEQG